MILRYSKYANFPSCSESDWATRYWRNYTQAIQIHSRNTNTNKRHKYTQEMQILSRNTNENTKLYSDWATSYNEQVNWARQITNIK